MPVHAVAGGFRFGNSGKTYRSKAGAQRQARAIYASGWREDATRLRAHRALSASKRAESRYVLDLLRIMGRVHAGILHVVHREHLGTPAPDAELRQDDENDKVGLGDELLRRIFRYVKPQAQLAFDQMADQVNKNNEKANALVGVQPRMVPGLAKTLDDARRTNVDLITNASRDFLDQVKDVLAENEGVRHEHVAKLLEERVGVSKSRAQLIARDQTLKLNAALNEHRQRAVGVTSFRWSTSHDERVRPSHAELDGQTFKWDDPPVVDDEEATPGEPVNCRCIALPIFDELEPKEEPEGGEEEAAPGLSLAPAPEPEPEPEPTGLTEDHFASVDVSPSATMSFGEVVAKAAHPGLRAWLEEPANRPNLRLEGRTLDGKGGARQGYYRVSSQEIALRTEVPEPTAVQRASDWGRVWRVGERGESVKNARGFSNGEFVKSKQDLVRDSFLHELGHHVHMGPHAKNEAIDDLVSAAFHRTKLDSARFRADVFKGRKANPAISQYATTNRYEYFAESFNAYMTHPEDLKAHDPNGFAMVAQVLKRLKIE